MAKQLALIDPDLLVQLLNEGTTRTNSNSHEPRPPPDPRLVQMADLNEKISNALTDEKDSELQLTKLKSYLSRYNTHHDKYKNTAMGPPLKVALPQPEEGKEQTTELDDDIVQSLPKTVREKGRQLIKYIKKSGALNWDKKGTIYVDDQALGGANIYDVVHGLVRNRKKWHVPANFDQIWTKLRNANIPAELISNSFNDTNSGDYYTPTGSFSPQSKKRKVRPEPSVGRWVNFSR